MSKETNPNLFRDDAKQITDMMFDAGIFSDSLTRDDINDVQNYIEFCLSSRLETYQRISKLTQRIEEQNKKKIQ